MTAFGIVRTTVVPCIVLLTAQCASTPNGLASTRAECELTGRWQASDGDGVIEFVRDGDVLTGVVVVPRDPEVPVGFAMLRDLRYNEAEGRYDGEMAIGDRRLGAEVRYVSVDEIEVKGKMGFFSRSFRWTRAGEPDVR